MAVYERGNGAYIAEREQPAPGSDREKQLEALADDAGSDWHRAEEPEPESKPAARKRAPAKSKGED
jgi:hypothetical protein